MSQLPDQDLHLSIFDRQVQMQLLQSGKGGAKADISIAVRMDHQTSQLLQLWTLQGPHDVLQAYLLATPKAQ